LDFRNFVNVSLHDPEKPKPLSDTPLTFINSASALVKMVAKLSREHEIAVSLFMSNLLLMSPQPLFS
jgi:hypothetical protein